VTSWKVSGRWLDQRRPWRINRGDLMRWSVNYRRSRISWRDSIFNRCVFPRSSAIRGCGYQGVRWVRTPHWSEHRPAKTSSNIRCRLECSSLWTWGSPMHWISHKYLLLTLSLINSSWNCLIQIISKLSSLSAVNRSSASVYQVSLWLSHRKLRQNYYSVRIFLSKDSCIM